MKQKDYTKGCKTIEKIQEAGRVIDSMDIPLAEKMKLTEPLNTAIDTLNIWLIKGRAEAETEVYKKESTFWEFIKSFLP